MFRKLSLLAAAALLSLMPLSAVGTASAATFNRPIVSVTFDDGWANQYINGRQVLNDNDINATFYLMSNEVATGIGTAKEYMSKTQAQTLFADGHEIASHTLDHCSMNGETKSAGCTDPSAVSASAAAEFITNEMTKSKIDLQTLIPGATVTNFAYPYGEYSTQSVNIGKDIYTSQRTVECAQNNKDSLDLSKLKACEVNASSTVASVKARIDTAIAQKTWLVLFYHEIANAGQGVEGDEAYTSTIADFTAIMQYINSRKADIDNLTVSNAINTINGTATPPPANNKIPVYRMANWKTAERMFTTDLNEANYAVQHYEGWVLEGIAFYVPSGTAGTPVYRMANWKTHERMFTADLNEAQFAVQHYEGWVLEGIAFYVPAGTSGTPVYRMANWKTHERMFTADYNEAQYAAQHYEGWVIEGIAFYVPQ